MANKKKQHEPDMMEPINLRLAPDVRDRADALVPYVGERTGRVATRSDVLREALMRGLRALEHDSRQEGR